MDIVKTTFSSQSVTKALEISSVSAAIQALTGEVPTFVTGEKSIKIILSPSQQISLRGQLEDALKGTGAEGNVNIDLGPVIYPVVLKRLIPLLLICVAAGYILHR